MSRSYKRNPVCTDGKPHSTQESKKFANKRVRNTDFDDLPRKGKGYKKVYESYDIHDWRNRWTEEEAKKDWERSRKRHYWFNKTFKEYMNYWAKCCKRK